MKLTRRHMLGISGGLAATLSRPLRPSLANNVIEIRMGGSRGGARVWFKPIGIRIEPGTTVRWINDDPTNSHTATAYHPENFDKPRRIPQASTPWDSGYLLPGDIFSIQQHKPGVYDYYCIPHELAGMVGRIIVGDPQPGWSDQADGLPEVALQAFPAIDEIMANGVVIVAD